MLIASHADQPTKRSTDRHCPCLECGRQFKSQRAHGEFCSTGCRKTWNNRRQLRGAELYDLLMALRFDREASKARNLWTILCRMASYFREGDDRERSSRRSWRRADAVLADKPYLHALNMVPTRKRDD